MIYRILSYLFLVTFVIAIILVALPFSLFQKEKPIIHVLLLDISVSSPIKGDDINDLISRIEPVVQAKEFVVRGYFSDKCLFVEEPLKLVEDLNKKLMLEEWLKGGAEFKPYLNLNVTNLEATAREAYEKWSPKGLVHILLVTDGKENSGNIINLRELVKQTDLVLTIVPTKNKIEDVFVKNLTVPQSIDVGQAFEIETTILATKNFKKVILQLAVGNNETLQKEVELKKGKNNFIFTSSFSSPGNFEISATVLEKDSFLENNTLTIQAKTVDLKEVLIVSNEPNSVLSSLVKNSVVLSPVQFPIKSSALLKYNSIVFDDVHWSKLLDSGKIEALKEYIEKGGKLFVSGGPHSFGFGDYLGSPLEKILPVKINPSGLVSMVVGIDISGSMESEVGGMRKIDIAINSLLDISKSLEPNDELGVHLYNEKRIKKDLWIPITAVKDFESELNDKIKIIPKPTGGTFILPALQSIYNLLSTDERLLRIAVIITDGESQETNFEEVLTKFQQIKPPISLVLIGADLSQESPLVLACKKVFGTQWEPVYIDTHWINLKECFKDALKKIAAGFSDEGQFKIFANQAHPISRTIQPFDSPFKGIILKSSLKQNSSSLLDIDDRFPLLAHRYLGQGEVISFQSGFYENWAGAWLNSAQGKSFQSMIASWLQQTQNSLVRLELENAKEGFAVIIHSSQKSMDSFAEVQLSLKGNKFTCVRKSNTTWGCLLNWQEASSVKSNEIYQITHNGESNKQLLLGEGLFPTIVSKEIYDIFESSVVGEYFPNDNIKWRWSIGQVPKIELKSYEPDSNIKFFFFIALGSFLLAILCRGRSS